MEQTMAVPALGMLCLGLFILTMMAAGIAVLVMLIKLVSGSTPAQPPTAPRPARSVVSLKAVLGGAALGLVGLMLLAGLGVTSVRSQRMASYPAQVTSVQEFPLDRWDQSEQLRRQAEQITQQARREAEQLTHQADREAEQMTQQARREAEIAMQRGRREAEAGMRRGVALLPSPPPAPTPVAAPSAPVAPPDAVSAMEAIAMVRPAATVKPPTSDRTVVESSSPTSPPAWLSAGSKTVGETQSIVISSKQYATQAEAEQDVGRQVVALLRDDLRKHTSPTWIQPSEIIDLPEAQRLAVREKYVETINRDFGTFFAPMYRVWSRVEISPSVREPALIRWRAAVAETRMVTVGGGFLALLCVPLAVLAFGYGHRRLAGKARAPLAFGVSAVVLLVWLTGAKLFAKYFVLWG
jgi:hypothetical protein